MYKISIIEGFKIENSKTTIQTSKDLKSRDPRIFNFKHSEANEILRLVSREILLYQSICQAVANSKLVEQFVESRLPLKQSGHETPR